MALERTIGSSFSLAGIGLHSGQPATVTLQPAGKESGLVFECEGARIPATTKTAFHAPLSSGLTYGGVHVRTVEHLLSALWGMGVTNALIEVLGGEVPIMDGSSQPWVEKIIEVGLVTQRNGDLCRPIPETVSVCRGDSFIVAVPAKEPRFIYGIDFPTRAIGQQWFTWFPLTAASYATSIAPARTFALIDDWQEALALGDHQGLDLTSVLVCDAERWFNAPLRFEDEPCRHKLQDLIGDLSLLGFIPRANIIAYKAGHSLHAEFATKLADVVNPSF